MLCISYYRNYVIDHTIVYVVYGAKRLIRDREIMAVVAFGNGYSAPSEEQEPIFLSPTEASGWYPENISHVHEIPCYVPAQVAGAAETADGKN